MASISVGKIEIYNKESDKLKLVKKGFVYVKFENSGDNYKEIIRLEIDNNVFLTYLKTYKIKKVIFKPLVLNLALSASQTLYVLNK